MAAIVTKPKGPEKPSTFVKELRLGAKFGNIEGMNLIEENVVYDDERKPKTTLTKPD